MSRDNDKRTSVKPEKGTSGSGKWSQYNKPQAVGAVDWKACDEHMVHAAIEAVTAGGDALIFGKTRDGGSLVLTICSGDERCKFYATSGEEMDAHLRLAVQVAEHG